MKTKKADPGLFFQLEKRLLSQLQKIISEQDLSTYRALVSQISTELGIDYLDCSAALTYLNLSSLSHKKPADRADLTAKTNKAKIENDLKMVRYRLEVGRKHRVAVEDLKKLLVEETGVDVKRIGYIDIHSHYTVIKLPEGMPTDIFNHLKSVKINQQLLGIKRLGSKKKSFKDNQTVLRGKRRNSHSSEKNSMRKATRSVSQQTKPI